MKSIKQRLESILNKIEEIDCLMEELKNDCEEKISTIEQKAFERESGENTEHEQTKIDQHTEVIGYLEEADNDRANLYDNIESAISSLDD